MRRKILSLLLVVIGSNVVLAAYAAASGPYININSGWGYLEKLPSGSVALNTNTGYNFNRALALEGGYTGLYSSQYGASVSSNFVDAAIKGTIPLSNLFSIYGRLGAGVSYTSWSGTASGASSCFCQNSVNTNFGVLTGVGANFSLSKHFNVSLEDYGIIASGNGNAITGNVNVLTGGVQFNF